MENQMKIVAVMGSPREKGTSARIAGAFLEEAGKRGAAVSTYFLARMDFRGCQGCGACKEKLEHCALKDDLTPLLEEMEAADVTVFASPVYFYDVSGQFKCFFDRTYSLLKPDFMTNPAPCRLSSGKKALLVIAQGDKVEKHRELADKYHLFLTWYGYDATVIHATDLGLDAGADVSRWAEKAKAYAQEMIPSVS
jgi:multimeric flavodoxin WrbA